MLAITADTYSLSFPTDRPFVVVNDRTGAKLMELFVLSSIHPLDGRDDTVEVGTWQVREEPGEIVLSLAVTSSVWEHKIFHFRCTPERFTYDVEVHGRGDLAEANYFGG